MHFKKPSNVIFMDFETTGLKLESLKVIEVAFKTLYKNDMGYTSLINPHMRISPSIVDLTHIDNTMLRQEGKDELDVVINIMNYISDIENSVGEGELIYFVAHNGQQFDFPIFKNLLNSNGFSIGSNWKFIDTLIISRKLRETPKHSMGFLCGYFGITNEAEHRAMGDVDARSIIYLRLSNLVCNKVQYNTSDKKRDTDTTEYINRSIKNHDFPQVLMKYLYL